MTNLFQLESGRVQFSPVVILIPEFKRLWKRARNKERFNNEIAYIFFISDYNSDYNGYGLDKERMIAENIMGNEGYKPDKMVLDAIEKYKELQRTPTLSLLQAAYKSLDTIKLYFDNITVKIEDSEEERAKKVKSLNITNIITATRQLADVCDSIKKLEDKVLKEEKELAVKIRRGGEIGHFEEAHTAKKWLEQEVSKE